MKTTGRLRKLKRLSFTQYPDDEKKAAIEAEYMPLIKELAAKTDPLANLAAIGRRYVFCSRRPGRGS